MGARSAGKEERRHSAEARLRPRKEEKEEKDEKAEKDEEGGRKFPLTCSSSSPSLQLYQDQGRASRRIHQP